MQLTQEYFDKGIANILEKMATKEDIGAIRLEMATKDELKTQLDAQTSELKSYVHEAFEVQQTFMDKRFDELIVKYDVRERVNLLQKDVAQLKHSRPMPA